MLFPFKARMRERLVRTAQRFSFFNKCVSFMEKINSEVRRREEWNTVSWDDKAWQHPFLTRDNIAAFRAYSERVWDFALDHAKKQPSQSLNCAFSVNIAQNSQKWAYLLQQAGAAVTLYPQPADDLVFSLPEWEDFDGEYADIYDAKGFLAANSHLKPLVPVRKPPMDDLGLQRSYENFRAAHIRELFTMVQTFPDFKPELAEIYPDYLNYVHWAKQLNDHDVVFATCIPIPAYLSGRPYLAFPVGWEMQYECGRRDQYGRLMALSFAAARFIVVSNPHMLGHCRRQGFSNAVYLPYPMDDSRYCPGEGRSREEWTQRLGPGVFVFSPCRLDASVKGQSPELLDALAIVAEKHPEVRFVFLNWGLDAEMIRDVVAAKGISSRFLFLPPVGKKRMIDYYRSCDIVLDQFVYGYYGATGLEAAAVGKPIVMKLRTDHYEPLYAGDVAPLWNAAEPREIVAALAALADSPELCREMGDRTRQWLVRNHGEARTAPILHSLLKLAADRVAVPAAFRTPLAQMETPDEKKYHGSCIRKR